MYLLTTWMPFIDQGPNDNTCRFPGGWLTPDLNSPNIIGGAKALTTTIGSKIAILRKHILKYFQKLLQMSLSMSLVLIGINAPD